MKVTTSINNTSSKGIGVTRIPNVEINITNIISIILLVRRNLLGLDDHILLLSLTIYTVNCPLNTNISNMKVCISLTFSFNILSPNHSVKNDSIITKNANVREALTIFPASNLSGF